MAVRSTTLFLQDIVDAAAAVAYYTRDGHDTFAQDAMVRDAVIYRLIQIGEAVKNLAAQGLDITTLKPEAAWRSAARTRDRLAHSYWAVDPGLLWVAVEQLPQLAAAARDLLDRQPQRPRVKPRRR
jgi:uncharacterized protein with HEPN domain